ncbi:MAG: hypothetical protein ACLPJH_06445 [Myxococcaceae bacterium]
MHRRFLPSLVLAVALVTPVAARADFGLRAAYLVPMYVNTGVSLTPGASIYTYGVGNQWLSNLDFLASWYPLSWVSVDVEGQFNLSGTSSTYPMTGIYVGPGVTFDFPMFLYARVALPIQVSGTSYGSLSTPTAFLRAGGGLKLDVSVIRLYLEATADFAYAGSGITFFSAKTINVAAGVWVKF